MLNQASYQAIAWTWPGHDAAKQPTFETVDSNRVSFLT